MNAAHRQLICHALSAASAISTSTHLAASHDYEDYDKAVQHAFTEAWQKQIEDTREKELQDVTLENSVALISASASPADHEQKYLLAVATDTISKMSVYTDDKELIALAQHPREAAHRALQADPKAARLYAESATLEERRDSLRLGQQANLKKGLKVR